MKEEKGLLEKIGNFVVYSPTDNKYAEIYIATTEGEYGCFMIIEREAPSNFKFEKMSAMEYINKTQQLIKNPLFNLNCKIGSKE